jgi:hypothetical protein
MPQPIALYIGMRLDILHFTSFNKTAYSVIPLRVSHNSTHRSLVDREQDRQCTYNVILRRVRLTIAAVENQYYIF